MERRIETCDDHGHATGTTEIYAAHENGGTRHRAFSVFIFRTNTAGGRELLIQQRSAAKPLFANKWANTCCSHPNIGEDYIDAGERRLQEELGFTTALQLGPSFVYDALDAVSGLSENEFDQILCGEWPADATVNTNPDEASATRWVTAADLKVEVAGNPENFGPWFPMALDLIHYDFNTASTQ